MPNRTARSGRSTPVIRRLRRRQRKRSSASAGASSTTGKPTAFDILHTSRKVRDMPTIETINLASSCRRMEMGGLQRNETMKSINCYWKRVWGIGIAGDAWRCVNVNNSSYSRRYLEVKVFILPLMICINLPFGRWGSRL